VSSSKDRQIARIVRLSQESGLVPETKDPSGFRRGSPLGRAKRVEDASVGDSTCLAVILT
jgi:hypothetical protein